MTTPTRAREAALFVHGLADDVRGQVLARLDSDERAQIEPLLSELAALGIPRLPRHQWGGQPTAASSQSAVEQAAQLPATAVLAALADANVTTLALLLRVSDWPWRGDLLASLDGPRREQTLALNRSQLHDGIAPAISNALCTRLIERAAQAAKRPAAPPITRSPRKGWFPWTSNSRIKAGHRPHGAGNTSDARDWPARGHGCGHFASSRRLTHTNKCAVDAIRRCRHLRRRIEEELRHEWQAQHREALTRERESARKEGWAQGLADAQASRQRAEEQVEEELRTRNSTLLAALQRAHADAIAAHQAEVGELAFEATCRILGKQALEREAVMGIVSSVCKEARVHASATVRLHPHDLRLLAGESKTLQLPDGPALTLQADDTLAHGGCQVETELGQFDGTLATQLQRLHQVLCASRNESLG